MSSQSERVTDPASRACTGHQKPLTPQKRRQSSGAHTSGGSDAAQPCGHNKLPAEEGNCETPPKKRAGRRVSFAAGPLDSTISERVAEDGHPDHEGEIASRRRVLGSAGYSCEPITKHSIKLLEAELGPEYSPSLTRLKRRFGLISTVQRDLPYLTTPRTKQQGEGLEQSHPPEPLCDGPAVMGAVLKPSRGVGPNSQQKSGKSRNQPVGRGFGTASGLSNLHAAAGVGGDPAQEWCCSRDSHCSVGMATVQ